MYPLRAITAPGTYIAGTLASFTITTIRSKSDPTGFSNIKMRVQNNAMDTVILEDTPMLRAPEGYYFLDWDVPEITEAGTYVITFSGDLKDQTYEKSQTITIIANPGVINQNILNSNTENQLMIGLYYLIKESQEIDVEFEQAKISSNGLVANLSFKNWNVFNPNITIYRNKEIITSGYTVDYDSGRVTFDSALSEFDTINADYNFSWFSGEELNSFLNVAIQEVNIFPPGTARTLGNAPESWYPAILYGSAKNVYRRLIHDLSYQKTKLVYGFNGRDGGGYSDAITNFKDLKENYEKDFEELKKWTKRGVWPPIGMTVTPTFTMPGGRSRWFRYLYKG